MSESVSEGQDGVFPKSVTCPIAQNGSSHSSLRASDSTSDPYDFDSEPPGIRFAPSHSVAPIVPPSTSQLDTNVNSSSPGLPPQTTSPVHQNPPSQPHNLPLYVRLLTYFGLGRRATRQRRSLVSAMWSISWGFLQSVVIIPMLILTATHFRSRSNPELSEWTACERPLGIWTSIWVIRVLLASSLAYWDFRRDRALHPPTTETESGVIDLTAANDSVSRAAPIAAAANGASTNGAANNASANDASANSASLTLRYNWLHSRLTLLCSLMTLSWFVTAHILEYTSIKNCRHSSPHLWWLVFGILCTMYLLVLEVVLLGFIVLVLAPILFIFWNILLICFGRHPLQHPNIINPEIGKLPKSVVERIPLVIYIPPPPEGVKSTLVGVPHSYPPKITSTTNRSQPRFKFLSHFRKTNSTSQTATEEKNEGTVDIEAPISWEAHWELGGHPFVTLEGNRAACAICLMDFEAPKRKEVSSGESSDATKTEHGKIDDVIIPSREEDQEKPKLVDAGDGVQPLRLLACSHVFHKTCLDPWLIDVSGRCPICQRAVEIPKPLNKKKPRRRS